MKPWCKVYFKNANSMEEVEDDSIQLIVTTAPEVLRMVLEKQMEWKIPVFNWFVPFIFFVGMFMESYRVLKPDGTFFLNMGTSHKDYTEIFGSNQLNCLFPYLWVQNILRVTNFKIKEDFIWVKTSTEDHWIPSRVFGDDTKIVDAYEHFFMFTKSDKWKFHRPKNTGNMLSTVWYATPVTKQTEIGEIKLTPFSEPLIEMIVKTFTDKGDTVLDPMAGTGTLGKVATKTGRNCILYEARPGLRPIMEEKVGKTLKVMT